MYQAQFCQLTEEHSLSSEVLTGINESLPHLQIHDKALSLQQCFALPSHFSCMVARCYGNVNAPKSEEEHFRGGRSNSFFFFFSSGMWDSKELGFVWAPLLKESIEDSGSLLWYFHFVRAHPLALFYEALWNATCAPFREEYPPVILILLLLNFVEQCCRKSMQGTNMNPNP